jgi:hypothetical protein
MNPIPIDKFRPLPGQMTAHLVENPAFGLPRTLWYTITIPLKPFNSGLEYETQPVTTAIELEFLRKAQDDWRRLLGTSIQAVGDESNSSIYLGSAHNPIDIYSITFTRTQGLWFNLDCTLFCDFAFENVGESTVLELTTSVVFTGLVMPRDFIHATTVDRDHVQRIAAPFVNLDGYHLEPQVTRREVRLVPRLEDEVPSVQG